MITPAQRAEIRRLFYGEHRKIGTIATQLGLHRETVRAAVEHESGAGRPGLYRPSAPKTCIIHEGPDSTAKGRDRRRNGSRTSSPASGAGVEQPTGGA